MTDSGQQAGLSTADMAAAVQPNPTPQDAAQPATTQQGEAPLFSDDESQNLRERWTGIQAGFVDEPRRAVEQADGLVAETMKRLAEMFAGERTNLESQWDRGDDISTEDLRMALQRYRSFFDRLLSI